MKFLARIPIAPKGVVPHKNKKAYTRKPKHKKKY